MWPIWRNKFMRLCHVYPITLLQVLSANHNLMIWNESLVSFSIICWRSHTHTQVCLFWRYYKSIIVHDFTLTFRASDLNKQHWSFWSISIGYMNRLFSIVIEKFEMLRFLSSERGWNVEFDNNRMEVCHNINAGMNDNIYYICSAFSDWPFNSIRFDSV